MLKARIIPCLLIKDGRCVKGKRFKDYIDVGSPVSSAKIYEAQGADELIVINLCQERFHGGFIDLVGEISYECYMPITVGGGIRNLTDMQTLFKNGADRILLNTAPLNNPNIIKQAALEYGSQAVVISIDYTYRHGAYPLVVNKSSANSLDPIEWALSCQKLGAGEILFTLVDNDGKKNGLDLDYIEKISNKLTIPIVPSGGVGSLDDIAQVLLRGKVSGVGVGSFLNFSDQSVIKIHSYLRQQGISTRLS